MSSEFVVFRRQDGPYEDWEPLYEPRNEVPNVKVLHGDELAYYMALKKSIQELRQIDKEIDATGERAEHDLFGKEQEIIDTASLLTEGKARDAY